MEVCINKLSSCVKIDISNLNKEKTEKHIKDLLCEINKLLDKKINAQPISTVYEGFVHFQSVKYEKYFITQVKVPLTVKK